MAEGGHNACSRERVAACRLLLSLLLTIGLLIPLTARAQNEAEGGKPKPPPPNQAESTAPKKNTAPKKKSASKAKPAQKKDPDAAKPDPAKTDAPESKPQPPPAEPDPEGSKPAGSETKTGSQDKAQDPAPSPRNVGEAAPPEAKPGSGPESPPDTSPEAALSDLGVGSKQPEISPEPTPVISPPPAGPDTPSRPQRPPTMSLGPVGAPNSAETRTGASSSANRAEGGRAGSTVLPPGIAEPPVPEQVLPKPGEVAGPEKGYESPQIKLHVPEPEALPPLPGDEEFVQPERAYIEERPLPPLDVTETDEERIAKSIEESLRLLDLSKEQRAPGGVTLPLAGGAVTFKASDEYQYDKPNRKMIFKGNAEILFQDIAVWADEIEINDRAAVAYAKGYVAIQKQDDILYCDEAYINYDANVLELFNVEGNTGGPKIQGTLYFFAHRAYGTFDRMILDAPEVTTCDPMCGSPKEFHISAHKGVYKANRSIVLHDVYVYAREHKIAYLPIFGVPLHRAPKQPEQTESDLAQNYGRNRSEGWFAKFAYTYMQRLVDEEKVSGGGPLLGVLKLDLTQKQGPGVGVRQDIYTAGLGITTMRAYYQQEWDQDRNRLPDGTRAKPQQNLELTFDQELLLSSALRGAINIERRNTFVPSQVSSGRDTRSNTWNNGFNLAYQKGDTNLQIRASQDISITGGQDSNQAGQQLRRESNSSNANISLDQAISDDLQLNVAEQYTSDKGRNATTGIPADQEGSLTSSLTYNPKPESAFGGGTATLRYSEMTDLDGDKNQTALDSGRSIREEKPSLEIHLPPDTFNDGAYFTDFTINLDNLITGTRRRPEEAVRGKLHVGGRDSIDFSHSSKLGTSMAFDQYLYDDGNAQYVLAPRLDYSYDSFNGWRINTSYNLQFQQGVRFPPVSGDRQTYRQDISYGASLTNYRSWKWDLRSGFDLRHSQYIYRDAAGQPVGEPGIRWYTANPVSSSFNWNPNRTVSFAHSVSYDLQTKSWRPTRVGATFKSPYMRPDGYYNWYVGVSLDAETDYATLWSTTGVDVDWFKTYERGWSTDVQGSFRTSTDDTPSDILDLTDEFIRKVTVRKRNCCTTLEAGWRLGINEVYLSFYLNALPQYPTTLDTTRLFDDSASMELSFPSDGLFRDIQQELFGTSESIPGLF